MTPKFLYSDYCTAFYFPERSEVIIHDEVEDEAILTIPVASEREANSIMDQWQNNSPSGCICEII